MAAGVSFRGYGISHEDLLIAATAAHGGMILVTGNIKHFRPDSRIATSNVADRLIIFQKSHFCPIRFTGIN